MKLEEQRVIKIDGENAMLIWTDMETGEERYEGEGQTAINVHGPQGIQVIPVGFRFAVEAISIAEAAAKFAEELQAAGKRAGNEAIEKIKAQQRKIQVPGEDQIIQIGRDRMRRNGSP